MTEHAQPLLLVSFSDPADVRRAYAALRATFACEFEDGGILLVDRPGGGRTTLRHDERADAAYRGISEAVQMELAQAESRGAVPTLAGKHRSRPDPNELAAWAKVLAWLLEEDPAGGDAGFRIDASKVVAAVNDRLRESELDALLIHSARVRPFYNALRDTIPGVVVSGTNRTYVSHVRWTQEAAAWKNLPPFRAPYS